jgi:hypothetical protein
MFKTLKCRLSGHLFVDSRSQPGVQTCVRCRHRQAFDGLKANPPAPSPSDPRVAEWPGRDGEPTPN